MIIFIDPGHGMSNKKAGVFDSGATNRVLGIRECDLALAYSLTLKYLLGKEGIKTYLSRDDNLDHCPIGRRVGMAENVRATHFISIHCNSSILPATGTETFYRNSHQWALMVQKAAVKALKLKDRGLKLESQSQHSKLAVMGFRGNVALLELGFISNRLDAEVMMEKEARIRFADNLISAIKTGRSL